MEGVKQARGDMEGVSEAGVHYWGGGVRQAGLVLTASRPGRISVTSSRESGQPQDPTRATLNSSIALSITPGELRGGGG